MKTGFLLIVATTFSIAFASGKIRNGYESKLAAARTSLQQLHAMLLEDPDMPLAKALKIRSKIEAVVAFLSYYELTEKLLMQLRMISPDIYNAVDTIRDKRGRPTDVYVRLVAAQTAGVPLEGMSIFSQGTDEDANHSEYGDYSVAVNIWILDKSLLLLCHELGHVRYVIPNLAEYCRFYSKHYRTTMGTLYYVGYNKKDQSGRWANAFVKQYLHDKARFRRAHGVGPEPTFAMLRRIERNNRHLRDAYVPEDAMVTRVSVKGRD